MINKFIQILPRAWRDKNRERFSDVLMHPGFWHVRKWTNSLPAIPTNPDGKVYVHLGCGKRKVPGCINVDARGYPHVHYLGTVEKLPFLESNSADMIYVSHCLEHISHLKVADVINEWARVLKPGGILRIAVPDFDQLVELYHKAGNDVSVMQGYLMGGQDYPHNFHYVVFNQKLLTELLEPHFQDIRKWLPNEDPMAAIEDCSRIPISLNIQGTKKG